MRNEHAIFLKPDVIDTFLVCVKTYWFSWNFVHFQLHSQISHLMTLTVHSPPPRPKVIDDRISWFLSSLSAFISYHFKRDLKSIPPDMIATIFVLPRRSCLCKSGLLQIKLIWLRTCIVTINLCVSLLSFYSDLSHSLAASVWFKTTPCYHK